MVACCVLLLAALGAGVWAAFWARRSLWRPLRELGLALRRWSFGDFSLPIDAQALAARPSLARDFTAAQETVRRSLEETRLDLLRERIKMETLFGALPDGLVITNLRGEVLFINPPAMDILGIKNEDLKAPGRGLLEVTDGDRFRMPVQEILKNHTHSDTMELPAPRDPGARAFYKTTVKMFSLPGGVDFGVLLLLRDVTNERRLDAMKEEFFQAVAHDLRAPLFAMQGYLRLLEKSVKPEKAQKGYFDAISQSCEKLTLFIQDTLDAARIETGQLILTVAPVDPRVMLQRVVKLFSPLAAEKGIRLELELPEDAPSSIDADERLLERVFNNLLSNAMKFTPRGGSISVEVSRAGAGKVEFSVSDTGPGIPAEQKTSIFEKFRQIDTGQAKTGFGRGLKTSLTVVRPQQGTIWVDSEQGLGSEFIFTIPIKQTMEV